MERTGMAAHSLEGEGTVSNAKTVHNLERKYPNFLPEFFSPKDQVSKAFTYELLYISHLLE